MATQQPFDPLDVLTPPATKRPTSQRVDSPSPAANGGEVERLLRSLLQEQRDSREELVRIKDGVNRVKFWIAIIGLPFLIGLCLWVAGFIAGVAAGR